MRVMSEALVFQKEFRKGKKGNQKGGSKGKKGSGRSKVPYGQCSNCMEFGHWSRDCPNMSVNNVAQKDSGKQALIPPSQSTPAAKSTATMRRIFQFGGTPSNPSSPTSRTLHVCLRRPWFYFMIQIAIGQK